ncbi:hypothetical protein SCLCIDRAFT_244488 [Scleroderma citrinum Foug A]|uniref:Uncharacterized protein n=1 Tax=Scleroderma citrinum Foug A TaxID=1036808 RepID=A0A0C2ZV36_9AGAM|nr:hypothetical protein SCLCIDRAFT_244488 [Scleroderma citrinum Foug A]
MHLPKLHQLALSSSSSLWSLQGIRIFGKTRLSGVWLCTFFRECLYVCIQALLTRPSGFHTVRHSQRRRATS